MHEANDSTEKRVRMVQALLLLAGALFLLATLVYNELLLSRLDPHPPLGDAMTSAIRTTQLVFLVVGAVFAGLSAAMHRVRMLALIARWPLVANILVAGVLVFLPLLAVELAARPFTTNVQKTTIFERDSQLGWRLKPNSRDLWGGAPVVVNSKGIIGPEMSYERTPGAVRVLYLGDSVAFGYGQRSYDLAFPFQVQPLLTARLGQTVETINASVPGFATWQERLFMANEGSKYSPDLIVIAFVLNDVMDNAGSQTSAGAADGWELAHTTSLWLDKEFSRSGLVFLIRKLAERLRFGSNVQAGAAREDLSAVEMLAREPQSAQVQDAWLATRAEMSEIFALCAERNLPVALVVFPYLFQFADAQDLAAPQQEAMRLAMENDMPAIDLLPLLAVAAQQQGIEPHTYFIDQNHLSAAGHQAVAEILAEALYRLMAEKSLRREQP